MRVSKPSGGSLSMRGYKTVLYFLAQLQRSHVYHITFPAEWKTIDITNIFSPFSKLHNSLRIKIMLVY